MQDSPWHDSILFLLSAGAIWWAGVRLERYADAIARRTGLGHAFTGVLLLAAATSLPELATTVTAIVVLNNPTLAVHNLLGGVALQTAILAVADATKRRDGALTFFSPNFALLIQGVGLVLLLQLAMAGIATRGAPTVLATSVWLVLLLFAYAGVMYLVHLHRGRAPWRPTEIADEGESAHQPEPESDDAGRPVMRVWLLFAAMSLVVLAGGWVATHTADALARRTGLGPAFLGATLLAAATSLPELSTTISAGRRGHFTVAVSNIFGSNAFDVVLLFIAELLYRGGSVLEHGQRSILFVASIGAVMTCLYLLGLMERQNRTVLGVGWDSAAAVLVYAGGMTVLYFIR